MKSLKEVRGFLLSAVAICVCVRLIFMAIYPLLPYLLGGVILLSVIGVVIHRSTKL